MPADVLMLAEPAPVSGFGVPATAVQFAPAPSVGVDSRVKPAAAAVQLSVRVVPWRVAVMLGRAVMGLTRTSWIPLTAGW